MKPFVFMAVVAGTGLSIGASPDATSEVIVESQGLRGAGTYTDVVTVSGNGTYTTTTGTNPGGYLPTAAQVAEGGYEVEGFQPLFGLAGHFEPDRIEAATFIIAGALAGLLLWQFPILFICDVWVRLLSNMDHIWACSWCSFIYFINHYCRICNSFSNCYLHWYSSWIVTI